MNICFGIISWLPDNQPSRNQRIERLDNTFKQLTTIFGDVHVHYIIIAQNWKTYKIPNYVKYANIFNYNKLGILNARKVLRKHFLESKYDYLIMCDDDIILKVDKGYSGKQFFQDLKKHNNSFGFVRYGWSLTFCAISRWIYKQQDMVDIDPEKEEGYEDTVFPNLLHYRFPDKEFKISKIDFLQHQAKYHVNHPSTWANTGHNKHDKLKFLTDYYVKRFKENKFEITEEVKREALSKWNNRPKTLLEQEIEDYRNCLSDKIIVQDNFKEDRSALPSLDEWLN